MALAIFFTIADLDVKLGWVGIDSLVIIIAYLAGLWIIRSNSPAAHETVIEDEALEEGVPSLKHAIIGFCDCHLDIGWHHASSRNYQQ